MSGIYFLLTLTSYFGVYVVKIEIALSWAHEQHAIPVIPYL